MRAAPTRHGENDGRLDVRVVAERLGMPLVADAEHGLWAFGPETAVTGRTLSTAVAPELELEDATGEVFRLSSLRGQKVVLVRVGVVVRLPVRPSRTGRSSGPNCTRSVSRS